MSAERLAAIGVIVAAGMACVSSALRGWAPVSDQAFIELMVRDVPFHLPIVGQWSGFGWNHPGPAQFYFMSFFYWLGASHSVMLLIATVVMHAVFGLIAWVCARRSSPIVGALVMVGSLAIVVTTAPMALRDPWSPYVMTLGGLALCAAAWSFGERDSGGALALFPIGVLLVQTNVESAPFVVLVIVVGVLLAFTSRSVVVPWRQIAQGLVVTVVLWIPPVVQQLNENPGNLQKLLDYRNAGTPVGVDPAIRVLTGALRIWPDGLNPAQVKGDLLPTDSWDFPFWAVAVLVALVMVTRSRDWPLLRGLVIAISALAGASIGVGLTQAGPFGYLGHVGYLGNPLRAASVFTVIMCVAAVLTLCPWPERRVTEAFYSVATILAIMVSLAQLGVSNPRNRYSSVIDDFADVVDAQHLPARVAIEETASDAEPVEATTGLFLELEKRGYRPGSTMFTEGQVGSHRTERDARYLLTISEYGTQDDLAALGWTILGEYQPFSGKELHELSVLRFELAALEANPKQHHLAMKTRRIHSEMEGIRHGRVMLILAGRPAE